MNTAAGMVHGLLEINPACSVRVVDLFDGYRCVIVDDFLENPERLRSYGLSRAGEFVESKKNNYPGPELTLPDTDVVPFERWWRHNLCHSLGFLRGGAVSRARLSIVTKKPDELNLRQRLCHKDPVWSKGRSDPVGIAGVLYLFDDSRIGGTAFFRQRDDASLENAYGLYDQGRHVELAAKYNFFRERPRYMTVSNEFFERMAAVEAVFNRAVFYDGAIFHTGDIKFPELITSDLRTGRLTANFFIDATRTPGS